MTTEATQFGRYAQLAVGSADGSQYLDLSNLQFTFIVKRGDTQTPNTAHIMVYNVSRETEQMLAGAPTSEFQNVTLIAGYQSNYGIIFSGNIRYVRTGHENTTDSFIEIVAADGDSAYNFAIVNTTLAAGSTPAQQIAVCQQAFAQVNPTVNGGYVSGSLPGSALPRGKVLFGMARDHMRTIANTTQSSWSIQDGALQVVQQLDALPNTAVEVNSATGMIGFPQKTIQGLQVRVLLNPSIKIGALIKINNADINTFAYQVDYASSPGTGAFPSSDAFDKLFQQLRTDADGIYQVLWTEHFGDTRGNDWYSDIIAIARSADLNFKINSTKFVVPPDTAVTLPPNG
jgi:hypothetical protein